MCISSINKTKYLNTKKKATLAVTRMAGSKKVHCGMIQEHAKAVLPVPYFLI